ncbi:MAG: Tim44 domain-containing protein, partial [Acetobacteraceae bacterium]|nr:Tim44 domain-containing protein [Acetobacteraceae bacterium]
MGGLPIDLILFAMVAAFLVLRLRSVLGRRTGFERPPQAEGAPVPA